MKKPTDIQQVIRHDLCNRCGSCAGLSGGKIVMGDKTGRYLPVIPGDIDDETLNLAWKACSGKGFDFPAYRRKIFGEETRFHIYTGAYRNIYVGHATDEDVRRNSASGGIISSILIYLLEKGMIDGAVVLSMSETEPWLTEPVLATTREEIMKAAQSKYIISSVNEILPKMEGFEGNLAYVGLPGQVQSVRLLQEIDHPSVKRVKYIFGPFYGNTLHFSSVRSFLRSFGLKDYREISSLYFRYGEWPGKMRVEMRDGIVVEMPKFHANYLIPFHIMKNSLLCTDLTNEYTDISGGDAWAPVYEERGKGFSMVFSRSAAGQEIIDNMVAEGKLELSPVSEEEAITMHSHGYDLKKRGAFIRMKFRSCFGLPNPDYGYRVKGFTAGRYLMEGMVNGLFVLLGSPLARWLVEKLDPYLVGKVFERARTFWKRSTHSIKRNKLE